MKTSVATSSKKKRSRPLRILYFILGCLSFGTGIVGIVLPVLPTVPFLLLAAFFWAESSERFHAWLVNHKHFGPPIQNWQRTRSIPLRVKLLALTMVWSGVGFTAFVLTDKLHVRLILLAVALTGTAVLCLIKTQKSPP